MIKARDTTNNQYGQNTRNIASFQGSYAGDPTSQWYWHIATRSMEGSNVDCHVELNLVYEVIWYNRVKLVDV